MKYGRNTPCPCGSGKKYKHCCLEKQDNPFSESFTQSTMDELKDAMNDENFSSMEALNEFTAQVANRSNNVVMDDFCGLSPEQMSHFLYSPFESSAMFSFCDDSRELPKARIIKLFMAIIDAINEAGDLKATATGNLPLKFCKSLAQSHKADNSDLASRFIGGIRSETDFEELHCTRIVAELAGLIRKYKGKFVLTKHGQQLLAKQEEGKIYFELFKAYTIKFNWCFRDGYPEIDIFQVSFLYTLFLLHKFGNTSLPQRFFEDKFIQAFPMACEMMPESNYSTPEQDVRHCYTLRAIVCFADFFGLVELDMESKKPFDRSYKVKKSPYLDKFIVFHLDNVASSRH